MKPYPGLFWSSVGLIVAAALFFILSVSGLLWAKATPVSDVGLYAVTLTLLLFGAGGLMLRAAKLHPQPNA